MQYSTSLLQQLWRQCENEEHCDVLLNAGKENMKIPAHRCILSASSDYFQGMFTSSMRESKEREIQFPTVDGNILKILVKFCYTGGVDVREDNVVELLKTADMLLLNSVVSVCADYLIERLHTSNCLGLALLAERYRCQSLLQKARDYSLEHFLEVNKTDEFLKLNAEQLGQLLAFDNLCVLSEKDVFNSLMAWVQHDKIKREKHIAELVMFVRLPLLEREFLMEHVKAVCTSTESQQLYSEAIKCHLLPDHKKRNSSNSTKPRKSPAEQKTWFEKNLLYRFQ